MQEFVLEYKDTGLQLKMNQKWTPFIVFFKNLDHISGRATLRKRFFLSNGHFCNTHLSGCFLYFVFLVSYKLQIEQDFSNISTCLHLTITNVIISVISWRRPMRLIMLHGTPDIETSMSCDSVVSSFLITFTSYMNKSYKNNVQYLCHAMN